MKYYIFHALLLKITCKLIIHFLFKQWNFCNPNYGFKKIITRVLFCWISIKRVCQYFVKRLLLYTLLKSWYTSFIGSQVVQSEAKRKWKWKRMGNISIIRYTLCLGYLATVDKKGVHFCVCVLRTFSNRLLPSNQNKACT